MFGRIARILVPGLLKLLSWGRVNSRRNVGTYDDSQWAEPLKIDGVPNLYRLTEDLYRSGQPTPVGFRNLETLGIRSCLSLRTHRRDGQRTIETAILCKSTPLLGVKITDDDVIETLVDICYKLPKPVLIHCYQGSDRTGLFCAAYRILQQNWSKEQAIAEMVRGGFGYHWVYRSFVEYLQNMDVEKLRQRLNSTAAAHISKNDRK